MSTSSDRNAVVGEITSSHLRFAIADVDEMTLDHYVQFRTGDFKSFEQALTAYLSSLSERPTRMSLAIAGIVEEGHAHLPRLHWNLTARQLQAAFSIPAIKLMSHVEAVSRCVPLLSQHELLKIGAGSSPTQPKAIAVVQEDIETAVAVASGRDWVVLPGRAGEMSFGAQDEDELVIFNVLRNGQNRTVVGNVLTSSALALLHEELRIGAGLDRSGWGVIEIIGAASGDSQDPFAARAVHHFINWLGRFVRDLAAVYGAGGGVYLAGDLIKDLQGFLVDGRFAAPPGPVARPSSAASPIPIYIVKPSNIAMRGAALASS